MWISERRARDRASEFAFAPNKTAPCMLAATSRLTRQSSQWVSGVPGLSFHHAVLRPDATSLTASPDKAQRWTLARLLANQRLAARLRAWLGRAASATNFASTIHDGSDWRPIVDAIASLSQASAAPPEAPPQAPSDAP